MKYLKYVACAVIAFLLFAGAILWGVYNFLENHAKASLATLTLAVNNQFDANGNVRNPRHVMSVCESIDCDYSPDRVIPACHPYADRYRQECALAKERLRQGLVKKFNVDFGDDWDQWWKHIDGVAPQEE